MLCASLFMSLTVSANELKPSESFEVRLSLSPVGYQTLLHYFSGEWKSRQDFYINVYDGSGWAYNDYKVRLKNKTASKWQWQVSQIISSEDRACGSLTLNVKKQKAWETEINFQDWEPLIQRARETFSNPVKGINSAYLESIHESFFFLFQRVLVPGPVKWGDREGKWLFTHSNLKMRLQKKIKLSNNKEIEVQIGQTWDWDENGYPRVRYELETEPDSKLTNQSSKDLVQAICSALKLDKRPVDMQGGEEKPSSDYTLKRL